MPFGTLKTPQSRGGVPSSSHLCAAGLDEFSNLDLLTVRYYTTYDAVKDLVPEEFELDDKPLVSLCLLKYGFNPMGAFPEFVSSVQVRWNGKRYNWTIDLILDKEGAIFASRKR